MTCSVCGKPIVPGKHKYYRQPSGKRKHASCTAFARPPGSAELSLREQRYKWEADDYDAAVTAACAALRLKREYSRGEIRFAIRYLLENPPFGTQGKWVKKAY